MKMGKYSTKGLHINPKKKKVNKSHKQRYWKKENKSIDKTNLYEVQGNRDELAPYVGEVFEVKAFLTNSYKYSETKRLLNSVILPVKKDGKNLYVNHLWVRSSKTQNVKHGYKKLVVKVIEYKDLYQDKPKYGVKIVEVKN